MRYDKATTHGRWPSILKALGVEDRTLSGNNTECPFCGGKDRFRFTDYEGAGIWVCNQCRPEGGNGVHFVMAWEPCDFKTAVEKINAIIPQSTVAPVQPVLDPRAKLNRLWSAAKPVVPGDPVAEYLRGRGLAVPLTAELRTHPECPYYEEGKLAGGYPAMLARVRDEHGNPKTLHVTYVQDGKKAPIKTQRKVLSKTGAGPSIRLSDHDDGLLAIAEGIETALAVNRHFKVPVWSVLSAGAMQQFHPPPWLTDLFIFADNDTSFTGQQAAYNLAHRLKASTDVEVVVMVPKAAGTDWADWQPKKDKRW